MAARYKRSTPKTVESEIARKTLLITTQDKSVSVGVTVPNLPNALNTNDDLRGLYNLNTGNAREVDDSSCVVAGVGVGDDSRSPCINHEGVKKNVSWTVTEKQIESYLLGQTGQSPKGTKIIIRNINAVRNNWGMVEPTQENLAELIVTWRKADIKPASIRIYSWAVKYWAAAIGYPPINLNPKAGGIKLPTIEPPVRNLPKPELIKCMLVDDEIWLRDRVLVGVMATCGARVGEVVNIDIEQVKLDEGILILRKTKGNQPRKIPMTKTLISLMREWMKKRVDRLSELGITSEKALFISDTTGTRIIEDSVRNVLTAIGDLYNIHPFHPHLLRHFYASNAHKKWGWDAFLVQAAMGHTDIRMTTRYVKKDEEEMKRLMRLNAPDE